VNVYELKPLDLRSPCWRASTWKGSIIVAAEDEKTARTLATLNFAIATEKRSPAEEVPYPPWRHSDLVSCAPLEEPLVLTDEREGVQFLIDEGNEGRLIEHRCCSWC
jgi:hypothetical protein